MGMALDRRGGKGTIVKERGGEERAANNLSLPTRVLPIVSRGCIL
jgi:hypothetical protein